MQTKSHILRDFSGFAFPCPNEVMKEWVGEASVREYDLATLCDLHLFRANEHY
jgi:hypothetical protein